VHYHCYYSLLLLLLRPTSLARVLEQITGSHLLLQKGTKLLKISPAEREITKGLTMSLQNEYPRPDPEDEDDAPSSHVNEQPPYEHEQQQHHQPFSYPPYQPPGSGRSSKSSSRNMTDYEQQQQPMEGDWRQKLQLEQQMMMMGGGRGLVGHGVGGRGPSYSQNYATASMESGGGMGGGGGGGGRMVNDHSDVLNNTAEYGGGGGVGGDDTMAGMNRSEMEAELSKMQAENDNLMRLIASRQQHEGGNDARMMLQQHQQQGGRSGGANLNSNLPPASAGYHGGGGANSSDMSSLMGGMNSAAAMRGAGSGSGRDMRNMMAASAAAGMNMNSMNGMIPYPSMMAGSNRMNMNMMHLNAYPPNAMMPSSQLNMMSILPAIRDTHGDTEDPNWEDRYHELLRFKGEYGHTRVPARYKTNPKLGRWVMTQRRQFTVLMKGLPSALTTERMNRLNEIGFIWGLRSDPVTMWNRKFAELKAYKREYGNCLVPQRYQREFCDVVTYLLCFTLCSFPFSKT
jgi:hypothetical protein